jgi:hypothetical protein
MKHQSAIFILNSTRKTNDVSVVHVQIVTLYISLKPHSCKTPVCICKYRLVIYALTHEDSVNKCENFMPKTESADVAICLRSLNTLILAGVPRFPSRAQVR